MEDETLFFPNLMHMALVVWLWANAMPRVNFRLIRSILTDEVSR